MSTDYAEDTDVWCGEHAVDRVLCGCPEPTAHVGRLTSRLLDRAALAELPPPEPLIEDTIDRRTVSLLAGYWGSCKSFIAQDWSSCVATGKAWQGREVAAPGRVLYVAAEGAHGLDTRLSAWETAWRHTIAAEDMTVLPVPFRFSDRGDVTELGSIIVEIQPRLVVVDTLARCAVGLDENSAKDMGLVVDAAYRLRDATGDGTVLLVHHTGKDKTTVRGSSSLEGGVDTVYQTEGDAGHVVLTRTKRKDGPTDDRLQLKLEPVIGTDSVILSTSRVRPKSHDRLMSAFVSAFSETGASKAELRMACDLPPSSFHRAVNTAVREGLLVNTGSGKRPFYVLGETS